MILDFGEVKKKSELEFELVGYGEHSTAGFLRVDPFKGVDTEYLENDVLICLLICFKHDNSVNTILI